MRGYEAFSIHSPFSVKGRSRAREASRKCGDRLCWAHPGAGATCSREQWRTPLTCLMLLHTHTDLSLLVSCLPRVITEWTTPHPYEQGASPAITDRVLSESLLWAEVLILKGKERPGHRAGGALWSAHTPWSGDHPKSAERTQRGLGAQAP